MSNKNRFFFLKIMDVLTKRIKSKVIFFEILLILIVALSIGLISTFYMSNALNEKAHLFSERIAKDLSKSVENNYISLSAVDDAVKSFSGTEGILYLGYHGKIVSSINAPAVSKRIKARKSKTNGDSSPDVSTVHIFMGEKLSKADLASMEDRMKGANEFKMNENIVNFQVNNHVIPCFEYYMPVYVKAADTSKKIGTIVLRYSQLIILKEIENIWILNAIITVYIIILGIYISIRGANTIVKPIVQLTNVVQQFGDGDLSVRANLPIKDEIGVLAKTFDEMMISVKEKLEMQKFISGSTVKMIQKSVTENQQNVQIRDKHTERKRVTLFFSDIRGFTSMSEKMDPQDVVNILNQYLDVQSNIIKNYNGDIDKYVGDEIVAVFENEDMYLSAVNAAREAQRKIKEMNHIRVIKGLQPVEIGVGIHAGEVIMGSIGSHDRMDFTVIGDHVNLAARLCSAAGKGEIIISKSIFDNLIDKKNIAPLPSIKVKGKMKPIEVYRVDY